MPDVGCSAGDPANTVLPWSVGEALPELPHTLANSTPLAPYLSRRMRSCAILVDRHVHKNGGSTVRDVFLEHERLGFGLYHGYQQKRWQHDFRALRVAARQALRGGLAPSAHVLLVESHFAGGSSGGSELIDEVLPSLRELSSLYASRGVECPLVAMTRVREPLDYYLSFYRWGVGFRQRDNPAAYGTTFQEWVERVPDLQSSSMVYSLASYFAEYLPKNYRRKVEKAVGRNPRAAWRQLRGHLDAFDIVGTMDRFDESLLLAHDLVGLPAALYKRNRPGQKGGYRGTNADVCPDMAACRQLVRRLAPRDHLMYDRYRQRFEEELARRGAPFVRRVTEYRANVKAAQRLWARVPRRQYLCRFRPDYDRARKQCAKKAAGCLPQPPAAVRCPIGAPVPRAPPTAARAATAADGALSLVDSAERQQYYHAACASVYANRQFECPWQFAPNSTLTDALGCWRPSTGFK